MKGIPSLGRISGQFTALVALALFALTTVAASTVACAVASKESPVPTLVPAPLESRLITPNQARDIFLSSLMSGEKVNTLTLQAQLGTAGEWPNWGDLAADAPIYRVTAMGSFLPFSEPEGAPPREFSFAAQFIDATSGRILGDGLSLSHSAPAPVP